MEETDRAPKPWEPGTEMLLVRLGQTDLEVLQVVLRFDRGRGFIVEAPMQVQPPWTKGERVLVSRLAPEGIWALRASVDEVLTPVRIYLLPKGRPRMVEKREYIRAQVEVEAAFSVGPSPSPTVPLAPAVVELSASGFRWRQSRRVRPGDTAWFCLRMPKDGRRACVPATVVRCEAAEGGYEVAGHFDRVDDEMREAILNLVFQTRLKELGIVAGRSWNEDP
ncbi:MAG TPA: PilZ domain-containing protein [Myxococcota bacterium]|nr:PilZ domain-containing protein [Myxococcota bacterium]HQK50447.1 PilZ domain-containing protein [Myxococcota bacterium]